MVTKISLWIMGCAFLLVTGFAVAQQNSNTPTPTDVTCSFADGKGLRIDYVHSGKVSKNGPPSGKAWTPDNKPFVLFLDSDVTIGNATVPVGAYSLFVVPNRATWTLVVNKDVNAHDKRDESKDIAKTSMETGELNGGEEVATVYLAHIAPSQCNVRIVYGKTMAWGEIHEK